MKIKYLTTDQIIKIHDRIVERSGGHTRIISYGNLDFVVAQAMIPKTIDRIAATLFYGVLTSHPFVDGNKRTGIIIVDTFLKEDSKEFVAVDKELWEFVHLVSVGKLEFEEVINWIKGRMK